VLAGAGVGLYIWVWPAGVVLVGILNVFLVLYLLAIFARGGTPDHLGITGAVTLTVTLLMSLIQLETLTFSVDFSLTQPLVAASGVVACVVIVGGSRLWDSMDADRPRWQFGAGLFVLGVVAAALVAVLLPDVFDYFRSQVLRVVGFTATATASTVGEAAPPEDPIGLFYDSYGFAFFTAMIGLVFLIYRSLRRERIDPTGFFVVVWSLFLLAMANTMTRFAIYMVLPVAVLNAFLAKEAFDLLGLPDLDRDLSDIRGYQVLSIAAVILIVTAPLAVQAGQGGLSNAAMDTADSRNSATPGAARWVEGLEWLQDETPEEGQWGQDPETGLGQGYYGTYARTDDFDYGSGDYGVLAWWDYGHWITVIGERIPIANPFQQNANYAADLLLSTNESYATEEMSDTMGDGSQTRYVMLDYQMGLAGTVKFGAPAAFERRYYVDEETGEYYSGEPPAGVDASGLESTDLQRTVFVVQQQNQQVRALSRYAVHTQRSMESLRTRLYQFHGSRAEPTYPEGGVVVADWETTETGARIVPQETQPFRRFDNMSAAESYVRTDGSSQIGGVFGKPSEPVPALEHFRLAWASPRPSPTPASRAFGIWNRLNGQPSRPIATEPWLKTFERVEGATVEGQGPANTTITAQVQMRMPTNGRTFTYEQEARTGPNGEFTMTVPYSTTGYDEFGPEQGRTNVSVRAAGPYRFYGPTTEGAETTTRPYATANVTEAQVIGADTAPTEVTLEETVVAETTDPGDDDSSSPDDGSTGNGSDGTDGGATPTPTPAATPTATPTDGTATPAATPTATPGGTNGSASLVPPAPAWLPPAPIAGLPG
jgi:dolichyl-diphosphooligosaccharide--protein glycosyltransferase